VIFKEAKKLNLFISLDSSRPQDQNLITDDPYIISLHFVPINYYIRDKYNCCNTQCKVAPTYYLKSSLNNIIGHFCDACREEHERHASDSNNIPFSIQKNVQ
jgi:hypothetical protein